MKRTLIAVRRTDALSVPSERRYLTVTAASKDGFLSRMTPRYRRRHAALVKQVVTAASQRLYETNTVSPQRLVWIGSLEKRIREFRVSTLEMMLEEPRCVYIHFAWAASRDSSESTVREWASYVGVAGYPSAKVLANLLHDVREADPIFHHEDLSELEGVDRNWAELILKCAVTLREKMDDRCYNNGSSSSRLPEAEFTAMDRRGFVSPELARLLLELPDCTDRMDDYLSEGRELPYSAADVEHFRQFLTTPSKALGNGVL